MITAGYSDAQAKAALILLLKTKVCGNPLATRLMADVIAAVSLTIKLPHSTTRWRSC